MSGPWLYSGVDQASASETKPIQKIGIDPSSSSMSHASPAGFSVRAGEDVVEESVTDIASLSRGTGYLVPGLAQNPGPGDSKTRAILRTQAGSRAFGQGRRVKLRWSVRKTRLEVAVPTVSSSRMRCS